MFSFHDNIIPFHNILWWFYKKVPPERSYGFGNPVVRWPMESSLYFWSSKFMSVKTKLHSIMHIWCSFASHAIHLRNVSVFKKKSFSKVFVFAFFCPPDSYPSSSTVPRRRMTSKTSGTPISIVYSCWCTTHFIPISFHSHSLFASQIVIFHLSFDLQDFYF